MARVDLIVWLLALTAGCTDGFSFIKLGVFTSAMSGNAVLLGIALGEDRIYLASRAIAAIMSYIVGVALSTVLARAFERSGRPRSLAAPLTLETLLLAGFAALLVSTGSARHEAAATYGLVALAGLSMGLQGGSASRLQVPGINTVVFTSTLTTIVRTLIETGLKSRPRHVGWPTCRQAIAFTLYVVGATAGGVGAMRSLHVAALACACAALAAICAFTDRGPRVDAAP